MSVLDAVMEYSRQRKEEEARARQAIPQAVAAFIQGRQQQIENQNVMLKTQIDAAKAGFKIENGQLVQDPTMMEAAQKNVLTIDDQGNLKVAGTVGKRDVVKQLPQSVEQTREKSIARGEAKVETQQLEQSTKLGSAVRRLGVINKQMNDALADDRSSNEMIQRVQGTMSEIGAKTGIKPNPKLAGVLSNIRPVAITMIRAFGEVGNLSETEQQGAIDAVSQTKLTEKEAYEKTKQFVEFALAGANPKTLSKVLEMQPDIADIASQFGVDLSQYSESKDQVGSQSLKVGGEFQGKKIKAVRVKGEK